MHRSRPSIIALPTKRRPRPRHLLVCPRPVLTLSCQTVGRAEEECVWCAGWFLLEAAAVLESSLASKKRRIPLEMGGSSKGKKKGGGQDAAPPACTCDDPFQCDCGNRPPRPSRGHKWDSATQQWGGKGHKQKGAALGQAAFVAKEQKVTTAVGNTTLAAHQRLPSQILAEYCQKHKRPRHFYNEIPTKQAGKAFQYRLILPESDAKKDSLRFIPAEAVANAEQAKEEAALLALLHFTPNLPHERKLPEPYRTTWLHALQAQKESKAVAAKGKKKITEKAYPASSDNQNQSSSYTTARPAANGSSSGGARASSGLRSAVAVNRSVKEEERKRQRQVRNARIQKHEAIRLANQPHPVFMSAKLRQAIERILRRERVKDDADDVEEDDAFYLDSVESEIQEYVEERLHREGFTRKQARDAFLEVKVVDHDLDKVYEACLQWLLIHVDEDDLPPSFDPRGRTLDVIVGATPSSKAAPDPKVLEFSKVHGMSVSDAAIIFSEALAPEEVLWQSACRLAGASPPIANLEAVDKSIMVDELEALEAIFAEDCQVNQCENIMIVVLPLDEFLELQINLDTNAYPEAWPQRILVRSKTSSSWSQGLSLLTETAKFLVNDIVLGEPMIFVIHGHVNELVQTLDELKSISLTPSKEPPSENARSTRPSQVKPTESATTTRPAVPPPRKRPRERSPFWSLSPTATPPAVAYPASNLKRIRASLPAAGARADFIKALKQADKGSHVVLCTGETGCGKSTQLPQVRNTLINLLRVAMHLSHTIDMTSSSLKNFPRKPKS
jgi:ATP-dependent RNA helicase DHX57